MPRYDDRNIKAAQFLTLATAGLAVSAMSANSTEFLEANMYNQYQSGIDRFDLPPQLMGIDKSLLWNSRSFTKNV